MTSQKRAEALKECIRHAQGNQPSEGGFSFQRQPGETARHWCIRHLKETQAEQAEQEAQKRASEKARLALKRKLEQANRLIAKVWKNHHAEFTKRVCGYAYDAALLAAADVRNGMSYTNSMDDIQRYLSGVSWIDPANAGTAPDELAATRSNSALEAEPGFDPWNYDPNDPLHRRDYEGMESDIAGDAAKAAWFGEAQDPNRRPAVVAAMEKEKCRLPPQ